MTNVSNPLDEFKTSYTVFEEDQLLREADLDRVVDFLDQQSRLTRVQSIGTGIISGLEVSWKNETLVVSPGVGITTQGKFISFPYDEISGVYSHFMSVAGEKPHQELTGKVWQLFDKDGEGRESLSFDTVKGRVVVLLLKENLDPISQNKFNDQFPPGKLRKFHIDAYLIERDDAIEILKDGYSANTENLLKQKLQGKFGSHKLFLERFGSFSNPPVEPRKINLAIKKHEEFVEQYEEIINSGRKRIAKALDTANELITDVYSNWIPDPLNVDLPVIELDSVDNTVDSTFIQYYYDSLADLILAYDEFKEAAFDLMDSDGTSYGRFSNHLLLGIPDGSSETIVHDDDVTPDAKKLPGSAELTRTPYFQPPAYNQNRARLETVKVLYRRLQQLVDDFKITGAEEVRVTPSQIGGNSLGERAIPYYYKKDTGLHEVWNPERNRKGRSHQFDRYERAEDPPFNDPLIYDLDSYNFLRIEGHIGMALSNAQNQIVLQRQKYNLPFELITLKLKDLGGDDVLNDQQYFHRFAEKHPGLEHRAGVQFGGSFVLVYRVDAELGQKVVVGDFCLPYPCDIAQPQPTITLEKSRFCENDPGPYDFELSPRGGALTVNGRARKKIQFVPKNHDVGSLIATYSVEGVEASMVIEILDQPKVDLELPTQVPISDTVPLEGTPEGGTYTTNIEDAISNGIQTIGEATFFVPGATSVTEGTEVKVTYTFSDGDCESAIEKTTVIIAPEVLVPEVVDPEETDPNVSDPDVTEPEVVETDGDTPGDQPPEDQ